MSNVSLLNYSFTIFFYSFFLSKKKLERIFTMSSTLFLPNKGLLVQSPPRALIKEQPFLTHYNWWIKRHIKRQSRRLVFHSFIWTIYKAFSFFIRHTLALRASFVWILRMSNRAASRQVCTLVIISNVYFHSLISSTFNSHCFPLMFFFFILARPLFATRARYVSSSQHMAANVCTCMKFERTFSFSSMILSYGFFINYCKIP